MNYLVLLSEFYPLPSANSICLYNIIKRFNKDDYFYIVGTNRYNLCKIEQIETNIEIHRIDENSIYKKPSFFSKIFSLLRFVFNRNLNGKLIKAYYKEGIQVVKSHRIDCLITISNPYEAAFASALIKKEYKRIKSINILFDMPFCKSYSFFLKGLLVNRKMRKTITTLEKNNDSMILMEYGRRAFSKYMNETNEKNIYLDIPCFEPMLNNCQSNNVILFAGKMDKRYRNPSLAIDLIANSLVKDDGFTIEFCGDGCEDIMKIKEKDLKERFRFFGKLDARSCDQLIKNASFLINISNDALSQVPSKIFKYFSTGKPIINFYRGKSDMLSEYFKEYGNYISVNLDDDCEKNVTLISIFLQKRDCVKLEKLTSLFPKCRPETYKNVIEDIVNNRLGGNENE